MKGKLYLVSTPIGNYEDITIRALNILKSVDFIICEEFKESRRMLSFYQIEKELFSLNEHNEKDVVNDILLKLTEGKTAALISDCGTPLFSDPGHLLVDILISQKIHIVPVPGANSLLPALIGSGFDIEKFYYYGWLSPNKDKRRQQLFKIKNIKELIVILDTPYRIRQLMTDVVRILGKNLRAVIAFQLTMEGERYYRGTTADLLQIAEDKKLKGEFVLIIENK
jgi:16S rRNA (cytidine1402-2'-O)-methyltransferase